MRDAAAAAFNKMVESIVTKMASPGLPANVPQLLRAAFVYGIKSLIHNAGGDRNSNVWQQINEIEGGWIGLHFDVGFRLRIDNPGGFLSALKQDQGYDVDMPYEKWANFAAFFGGTDHDHSARFITMHYHDRQHCR
jgi:hypothetical protein